MNGALAKTSLVLGLCIIAWIGFHTYRCEAAPVNKVPRVLRDLENSLTTGDVDELATVLRVRPDLANASMSGGPPLHIAAKYDQPDVIRYLLEHGADRYARGAERGMKQCTALHWACLWGSKAAAEVLIDEGIGIEDRHDLFNSTPLYWAALGSWVTVSDKPGDYEGVVRMLVNRGAAVDTRDRVGRSAISVASSQVAKVLKECRATSNARPATRPARASAS